MRCALPLLASCALAAAPAAAEDHRAVRLEAAAGAGLHLPGGGIAANVGPNLSLGAALDDQIALVAYLAHSRHTVRPDFERLDSTLLSADLRWRLDYGRWVPWAGVGLGVLRVRTDEAAAAPAVYVLSLGLDVWTRAPLWGLAVGLEVRYVGLLRTGAFPVHTVVGLALRYAL